MVICRRWPNSMSAAPGFFWITAPPSERASRGSTSVRVCHRPEGDGLQPSVSIQSTILYGRKEHGSGHLPTGFHHGRWYLIRLILILHARIGRKALWDGALTIRAS